MKLKEFQEICERFIFVNKGSVTTLPDWAAVLEHDPARAYLGELLTERAA